VSLYSYQDEAFTGRLTLEQMIAASASFGAGEPVDLSQARFSVHGNTYALTDLRDVVDDRWGFREPATLIVPDRPVPPGEHELSVVVSLRISYLPVPSATRATKTLALIE
jgi:hypothetical protein